MDRFMQSMTKLRLDSLKLRLKGNKGLIDSVNADKRRFLGILMKMMGI